MIFFVLGFCLVQLTVWVLGTYVGVRENLFVAQGVSARDFFLPMVLLPVIAAWCAAEVVVLLRPPRLFSALSKRDGVSGHAKQLGLGIAAGLAQVLGGALVLMAVKERVQDVVVLPVTAASIGAAIVLLLPCVRRRGCTACGYNWTGLTRCPECGTLRAPAAINKGIARS